jgi:hypothetical protein
MAEAEVVDKWVVADKHAHKVLTSLAMENKWVDARAGVEVKWFHIREA